MSLILKNIDITNNQKSLMYLKIIFIQVNSKSYEDCEQLCLSTSSCVWFTHDWYLSMCYLLQNCPTLDESYKYCTSSNLDCSKTTGNS